MKINYIKASPSQNTTVIVTSSCPQSYYTEVAEKIMSYEYLQAEQVGFIVPPKSSCSVVALEMAGGEFCGNAALSVAASARYKGICSDDEFFIEISGEENPVKSWVKPKSPYIYQSKCKMPSPLSITIINVSLDNKKIKGRLVNFKGISHFVFEGRLELNEYEQTLAQVVEKCDTDAVGIVPYDKVGKREYAIKPYVYVRDLNTKVFERGCGSGSLALGIYLKDIYGYKEKIIVYQPGGTIDVEISDDFYILTDVKFTSEGVVLL